MKKNIIFSAYYVEVDKGRKEAPPAAYKRDWDIFRAAMGFKDPVGPVDNRPDPNPVKTTRDHLGNVTKMEYQAQPTGKISPHVHEEDTDNG